MASIEMRKPTTNVLNKTNVLISTSYNKRHHLAILILLTFFVVQFMVSVCVTVLQGEIAFRKFD